MSWTSTGGETDVSSCVYVCVCGGGGGEGDTRRSKGAPLMLFLSSLLHLVSSVRFLQCAYLLTGLAPRILLDSFKAQISKNSAFRSSKFDAWDDSEQQHVWLKEKYDELLKHKDLRKFHKEFISEAIQNNAAHLWDVTTLCAAVRAIMKPSGDKSEVTKAVANLQNLRNTFFHRSTTEIDENEFKKFNERFGEAEGSLDKASQYQKEMWEITDRELFVSNSGSNKRSYRPYLSLGNSRMP